MRNFYFVLLIFSVLVNFVVYHFSDVFIYDADIYYIYCIASYTLLILLSSFRQRGITALLVFQAPFGLFILGRFIGHYLDYNLSIESIDFFYLTTMKSSEVVRYLSINMLFFIMVFLGYFINPIKTNFLSAGFYLNFKVVKWFSQVVVVVTIVGMFIILKGLYATVSQYGYAALYILKKENANDASSIFITLLLVTIGIVAKEGYRPQLKILMAVLFCYSFSLLFMGARGPMMTYIILWLWLYKKKINIFKLGGAAVAILGVVQYMSALMRATETQYDILAKILYDMGTTFIVLPLSSYVSDWPAIALIQNFIPMASRIASTFMDISPYEANLANYLGYYLNPDLYWKGVGLGWSVVIDFSIYAQNNILLVSLFAMFFGAILRTLDSGSRNNGIIYGLTTTLILPLGFLYRSGLFSVVPLAIYFFVILLILSMISNLIRRM